MEAKNVITIHDNIYTGKFINLRTENRLPQISLQSKTKTI